MKFLYAVMLFEILHLMTVGSSSDTRRFSNSSRNYVYLGDAGLFFCLFRFVRAEVSQAKAKYLQIEEDFVKLYCCYR